VTELAGDAILLMDRTLPFPNGSAKLGAFKLMAQYAGRRLQLSMYAQPEQYEDRCPAQRKYRFCCLHAIGPLFDLK
jgi:hypothetical protein